MESHFSSPYRKFIWKWWAWYANPMMYMRALRWYYQRATRGWADYDTWGLDSYICEVMVPALEHLRKSKHGVPCPPDAVMDPNTGEATPEEFARWQSEWDKRLDEMIAGFKAADAVMNGPPDRFYTERRPELIAAEEQDAEREAAERADGCTRWVRHHDYDLDGIKKWEAEQEVIRRKGFAVFAEHFYNLWD